METNPPYAVTPAPDDIKITKREWEILKALRILRANNKRGFVVVDPDGTALIYRAEPAGRAV